MPRCWAGGTEQLWLAEVSRPCQAGQTQYLANLSTPLWVQCRMGPAQSQAHSWVRAWMTQETCFPQAPWTGTC